MSFRGYFVVVALLHAWIVPKLVVSQQRCLGGFDIYFILDKSGSVLPKYFTGQTVDFVEKTVQNFIGTGVRFSFITFSEKKSDGNYLKLTGDRAKIKTGLEALRQVQPGGGTWLSKALDMANNQVKDQLRQQSAFSIFIILTDGRISDIGYANEQSKKAKAAGTIVYAIGVGVIFDITQLNLLSNQPPEDFVFTEPSYNALQNLTSDISTRTCVEITSVSPTQACLGENNTVTLYGRGFEKFNSAESHSVWCGFNFNSTHRQVTKASLVEENRLVCPVPILNDTESVLMLQVSLNNGKTFVSSNVNISAKNCTSGVVENRTKTENGTKTHKQEEKPRSAKRSQLGLVVALLLLFAFLVLLAVWWFWPRFSRKPPRNYQPAVASEPIELPAALPPRPPPPAQKTASGRTKWPTVDASFYGGGTAGGIVPVRVDWGDKGSTEAGARLAQAKPSIKKEPIEDEEHLTGVSRRSSTPGCWTAAKIKVMAGVDAVSVGYSRVASHRPQPGGNVSNICYNAV
ncbi:Anthrax toxin receptor 1 [Desmophyllum pertusum]|uniref:Anthrax toxin receptor 1 n=1 Tax=Desmophyllum pertusum TaxID=174260 RepID=A0A9W9YC56_9CNID|nr:Anthrax toxin receptor 1 [Desmophyllum pertusum]